MSAPALPRPMFANADYPVWVLGLLLVILGGKLVWVQAIRDEAYSASVGAIVEKRLRITAPRGRILDVQGAVLAGARGIVHLVADARELRKMDNRRAARALRERGLLEDPNAELLKREAAAELRADFILDLAGALGRTLGAPEGDVNDRAADIAARLGRLRQRKDKDGKITIEPAPYVPIARELPAAEEARVREILRKHCVSGAFALEEDFERSYPAGAPASAFVGFYGAREQAVDTNKTGDPSQKIVNNSAPHPERVGRGGIEEYYEEKLRGAAGSEVVQRAPNVGGGFIDLDREIAPVPGADIYLTIDAKLNSILYEEAAAAFSASRCDAVAAVMLDARTGRILAMSAYPSFDPNAGRNVKNHALNNFASGFSYEPGSSIKPFTVAAAMDAGSLAPEDRFDVNYPVGFAIQKRARPIRDSHVFSGVLGVAEVLQRSSNIGAVKIGQRAGAGALAAAFLAFGFNEKTGVELPGEGKSQLPNTTKRWDVPNTLSSVAFGYQFYTTPLRLAAAYAMLANGGMRVEPRIVDCIRYPGGAVERAQFPPPRRAISERTSAAIREMLQGVVLEEHGTAHRRAETLRKEGFLEVDGFAGKTGTAVIHKNPALMNGTFAVFGPMPSPRITVVFVAYNSSARFGGDVCAAPAMRALARALRALGIDAPAARGIELNAQGAPPVLAGGAPIPEHNDFTDHLLSPAATRGGEE